MRKFIVSLLIMVLFMAVQKSFAFASGLTITLEVLSPTSAVIHWDAEPGVLYQLWHNGSPLGTPRDSNGAYQMNYSITTPEEYGTYYVTTNTGLTSNTVSFYGGGTDPGTPGTFEITLQDLYQDGTWEITWGAVPGAAVYEIYIDGVKDSELLAPNTVLTIDKPGNYSVKALDSLGNVLAQSNSVYYDGSSAPINPPPDSGTVPGTCNGCDLIRQMLACPEWDQFMGEWQDMLGEVIPPPPDWDSVAQTMRDTIVPAITNDMLNRVVPAMGNEISNRLGNASYNGDTGIDQPNMNQYAPQQPNLPDMGQKMDWNMNDQTKIPTFEYQDMTPTPAEMITIPDPLNFDNPAQSARPEPQYQGSSRETNPSQVDQTKPTNPVYQTEPRPTVPIGGQAEPKPTIPSGEPGRSDPLPTNPAPGDGKPTIPMDWR